MLKHFTRQLHNFSVSKKKRNLYDVLKIQRTASSQQIKASYYKLAKQSHPDTHKGKSSVTETFKQINEAYNVLKDAVKRKQYDEQNFTVDGEKKEYRFYDTQHNYGYNTKSYRKNPYHTTNPFESAFQGQNPYQSNTNPYNSDFSSYVKKSQQSTNPQTWQEYVKNQHRKNVAENKKLSMDRLKKSNMIMIIVLGVVSVYIIGELTFKIYEFNSFYRIRTFPEKLDSRELMEYQQQSRMGPRKDYY